MNFFFRLFGAGPWVLLTLASSALHGGAKHISFRHYGPSGVRSLYCFHCAGAAISPGHLSFDPPVSTWAGFMYAREPPLGASPLPPLYFRRLPVSLFSQPMIAFLWVPAFICFGTLSSLLRKGALSPNSAMNTWFTRNGRAVLFPVAEMRRLTSRRRYAVNRACQRTVGRERRIGRIGDRQAGALQR